MSWPEAQVLAVLRGSALLGYARDELADEAIRWLEENVGRVTLHDRREVERLAEQVWTDEPEFRAIAPAHSRDAATSTRRTAQRPRRVPDAKKAIGRAIDGLRRDDIELTWENVATRIGSDIGKVPPATSTVRLWARQDGLPGPADPSWRVWADPESAE